MNPKMVSRMESETWTSMLSMSEKRDLQGPEIKLDLWQRFAEAREVLPLCLLPLSVCSQSGKKITALVPAPPSIRSQ